MMDARAKCLQRASDWYVTGRHSWPKRKTNRPRRQPTAIDPGSGRLILSLPEGLWRPDDPVPNFVEIRRFPENRTDRRHPGGHRPRNGLSRVDCRRRWSLHVPSVALPHDTFTQLLGINGKNVIAGHYGMNLSKGFIVTLTHNVDAKNLSSSAQTHLVAINSAGSTGGFYMDTASTTHGFLRIGGTLLSDDAPNTTFNQILGLNNCRVAEGYFHDSSGVFHPYLRFPNGTFQLLNTTNSQTTGINDAERIVRFFTAAKGNTLGIVGSRLAKSTWQNRDLTSLQAGKITVLPAGQSSAKG
jgi:hypothetical protein